MSRSTTLQVLIYSVCLAAVVGAAGCQRQTPRLDLSSTVGNNSHSSDSTMLDTSNHQDNLILCRSGLQSVYFDYDSASLRPDALATLKSNAEKIEDVPGAYVQIVGHCDERGTQEYNLALGERRALAVRSHLQQLGVDGNRLQTLSMGEEQPAVTGGDESSFAQNRRAEFRLGSSPAR